MRVTRGFTVHGTVQGVGFRPFVHRLAGGLGLSGWVANVDGHVEGEVAGPADAVAEFRRRLRTDAPVLACVREVRWNDVTGAAPFQGRGRGAPPGPAAAGQGAVSGSGGETAPSTAQPRGGAAFDIRRSGPGPRSATARREIPADAAICDACLRELFTPGDRRYRYPFVNCTDCGPRATIIEDLPYDRVRTTMRRFPLCADCAVEYTNARDRRFHAEPVACPACGPTLAWESLRGERALKAAVGAVAAGGIIAVKGLGGYQLVCDATDPAAVAELRRRKRRPTKPFAVMVRDVPAAGRLARLNSTELALLTSSARPVVLLRARRGQGGAVPQVAPAVHSRQPVPAAHPGQPTPAPEPGLPTRSPAPAPVADRLGLFLPTTGLHHLLLHELDRPLVVTSGNLADEPIAIDDTDACRALKGVADGFLTHDRPIRARYDDSVVAAVGRLPLTVRRARGLAPAPLPLDPPASVPLAGAGAQLKHTFTLADAGVAHVGPHEGDLADAATYEAFTQAYADMCRLTGITPRAVAHDLHPGYLSTRWALEQPVPHVAVQHHHAHVAACAAEHGVRGPFLGVACDGLGLGDDGTLWGGEVFVADLTRYRRVGRFATAPLPGGEAAVRHPSRMALGHVFGAEPLGSPSLERVARGFLGRLDARLVEVVRSMVEREVNCPRASSAGRLFDTVASLLGLVDTVSYEGEAAVALEAAVGRAGRDHPVPLRHRVVRVGSLWVYDSAATLGDLLERQADGEPVPRLAAAFHSALAAVTAELVARAVEDGAPRTVCLGGGCFVNVPLLTQVRRRLRAQGLRVLVGRAVPVGDGGISYGQAAVAAARLTEAQQGKAKKER
ncbi:Kae1-like domain-containing protein [Streptomyces flavofungini]|uniref:Carbamoyltransferase n=1 Tax=Streptomyces flavofungini TaxID=68200 RepID=A0ABS0XHI0_9ACTN|nr:carbamoyltransferase HypF [Streptomyces flavofungini]MBJ3812657.1 carbamoyltransferase HypF [Streptomyces flavofungini]GHC89763.1 carbamoyltransferase [Streptomyces flavofungini]